MHEQTSERREDARFLPPPRIDIRATLRPGCIVVLIDVSAGGALVQAARPLRPGARVHLLVATPARRFTTVGSVLRCMVWSLIGDDGVIYRAAIRFDQRVEWNWAEATRRVQALPEQERPTAAAGGKRLPQNPPGSRFGSGR